MPSSHEEREASAAGLNKLAEWIASFKPSDMSERVEKRARLVLLDDLGAMLGGSTEKEVVQARNKLLQYTPTGQSTIFGPGFPAADLFTAAELNGIAACWIELDEGCSLGGHAGIYVLPALLALAQTRGATIGDVLTSLTVGYEAGIRLSETWKLRPLTLHKHGVFPAMTAAAACSHLSGSDAETTLQAMAAAAALTIASPYDQSIQGAFVRNLWTGIGASMGLKALLFAEAGICGLPTTMYSTFHDVYGASYQPGRLEQNLGTRFAIDYGWHKAYACCRGAHHVLEALLELRERHAKGGEVPLPALIVVKTQEEGMSLKEIHPKTTLGAKFSLAHAVAAAWKLGTGSRRAFTEDTLADREIAELRERVQMEPIGSPPNNARGHVTVYFENGETDEAFARYAMGDPEKPFTDDQLFRKFAEITDEAVKSSPQMAEAILHIPGKASVADLVQLLKENR